VSKPYNSLSDTRRLRALRAAGYRCEECGWQDTPTEKGRSTALNVHHRDGNHSTLHDHRPENLRVVCVLCHARHHGTKPNRFLASVIRQAVEEMAKREGVGQ
jgi:hypothetical protein